MQTLADGCLNGLMIALLAVSFNVVYLPTRVFAMALGGSYALAPFVAWTCLRQGWPGWVAVVLALLGGVLVSTASEWLNHRPLERRRASAAAHMISSLGLYIVVVQVVVMIWGTQPKVLRAGNDPTVQFWGFLLTQSELISFGVSTGLLAVFYLWLRFTTFGLRFRALADNPVELSLRGHDLWRLRLLAFALAGLFAGAASLCAARDFGFNPHGGLNTLLLAIVATVIGGRFSFAGPLVGGLVLGIVRSNVAMLGSSRWQEAATFLLLAGFLLLRPVGILGMERRLEAES